ncbi:MULTISPECIES: type IV conjugative transfer system protein TraL [Herbaspirillum]|uniref:Type IV conjugative transfer system protein TraL n=2 Tax=Herbaspirillum huttiense TaxID=863372 RepID=A0AAJ2H7L0_9BURK|nr:MULTISPECIES: type IV conjugative transfer system protein TraL [Herbaspirillum]MDR9837053.1 type IV conjugative transfer system protein TraL [Herbaspirillum huttiense]
MNEVEIPRYVDSQIQLFFWEFDEAIVFAACLGLGIVLSGYYTLLGLILGYYGVKRFRRFKNGELDGILLHLCYWAGLFSINKHYEDSAVRDFFY